MINLAEWDGRITHDGVTAALAEEFGRHFGLTDPAKVTIEESDVTRVQEICDRRDQLESWETVFGSTPDFAQSFHHSFSWGAATIKIACSRGRIAKADVEVQSATVGALLRETLEGSPFQSTAVAAQMEQALIGTSELSVEERIQVKQLINWLCLCISD